MSRVHCLDCRMSVVVDPQGRCPEGHEVGEPGARIDQAMGSSVPYPDEPEPWVGTVVLEPADRPLPARSADHAPRRPEPAWRPDHHGGAEAPDHDALLVEFQALGELGDGTSMPPAAPASSPTHPPAANPPAAPPPTSSPSQSEVDPRPVGAPSPEDLQDVLAELSALESLAAPTTSERPQAERPAAGSTAEPAAEATSHHDSAHRLAVALDDFDLDDLSTTADRPAPATPAAHLPDPRPTADGDRPAEEAPAAQHAHPAPAEPPVDLASFTARGSAGRGGRAGKRRLFGR